MNANEGPNEGHRKYMSAEGGPDQSMSQVYKNCRINSFRFPSMNLVPSQIFLFHPFHMHLPDKGRQQPTPFSF